MQRIKDGEMCGEKRVVKEKEEKLGGPSLSVNIARAIGASVVAERRLLP